VVLGGYSATLACMRKPYPTDLSDAEWNYIEPHMPAPKGYGRRSRSVGAYLGLVPATARSGDRDPQKRISKEGDEMLRKLLVGSAHYILGPFGSDSDLRRHGGKIASRGAKNAKKRAAVTTARKLCVLLHRLWVSGKVYEPLYNARRRGEAAV
jgi:hypothetical protein